MYLRGDDSLWSLKHFLSRFSRSYNSFFCDRFDPFQHFCNFSKDYPINNQESTTLILYQTNFWPYTAKVSSP